LYAWRLLVIQVRYLLAESTKYSLVRFLPQNSRFRKISFGENVKIQTFFHSFAKKTFFPLLAE